MSALEINSSTQIPKVSQNAKSTLGLMIGVGIILLALASFVMQMNLTDLFTWLEKVFSWFYLSINLGAFMETQSH